MLAPPTLTQQHIANYNTCQIIFTISGTSSVFSVSFIYRLPPTATATRNLQRDQSDLDLTMRDLRLMDGTAINRHPVIMPRKTSIVISLDQTVKRYVWCYCFFVCFLGGQNSSDPPPAHRDVGRRVSASVCTPCNYICDPILADVRNI